MVWQKGEKSIIEPYFRIQKWIFFYDNVNKSCLFGKYFWWFPISSFLHHRSVLFFSYILDKLFNFFLHKKWKKGKANQSDPSSNCYWTKTNSSLENYEKKWWIEGCSFIHDSIEKMENVCISFHSFFLLEEIFLLSICWINKSNSIVLLVKSMHGC